MGYASNITTIPNYPYRDPRLGPIGGDPSTGSVFSSGAFLPQGPNLGLSNVPFLQSYGIGAQQAINQARVPNSAALEQQSSTDIAGLLNPPALFPDTSRRAAEVAAGRGVAGSGAAFSTATRMTDEERLRRIALGEQLLSAADARNPGAPFVDPTKFGITPYQQAELATYQNQGHGSSGGGGGRMPAVPPSPLDLSGFAGSGLSNPLLTDFGEGGAGGGGGNFNLDQALNDLGIGGLGSQPEGTYYDPETDTSNFDFLPDYYG